MQYMVNIRVLLEKEGADVSVVT